MFQTVNHAVQVVPMCFLLGGCATAKPSSASFGIPKVEQVSADVFRRTARPRALSQANAQQCILLQAPPANQVRRLWHGIKGLARQWGR